MGLSKILRSGEKSEGKANGDASTLSINTGLVNKEYLWACELSSKTTEYKWTLEEEMDDDDEDYIQHGLIIKSICLGAGAVDAEENVVVIESVGSNGEPVTAVIANLTKGVNPMVSNLSLTLEGKCGATFKLAEGNGPVSICGNEILDYPEHDLDGSQTEESRLDETEDDQDVGSEEDEDEEDESFDTEKEKSKAKTVKRKAATDAKPAKNGKKAKITAKDDKEDEEDDEEDYEEMEEEDESDSEEEVAPKKTKKENGKAAKPKPKSPAVPAGNKKAAKKGKK